MKLKINFHETFSRQLRFYGMNSKSDKTEKLEPQDSKQKEIRHPQDDNEAVVKPADHVYRKEEADFGNAAKKREEGEQPVQPTAPKPKK